MNLFAWLGYVWRDARVGGRLLLKSPLFTVFAALVLAIGIGANVTVFTFVYTIFLRPLDVPAPGTFVRLKVEGEGPFGVTHSDYERYRDSNQSMSSLAMFSFTGYHPGDTPVRADAAMGLPLSLFRITNVTGNFFATTGLTTRLGRPISVDDAQPGSTNVVMLSEFCWKHYLAADSSIIGRTIFLNNTPYTVIGVASDALATVINGGIGQSDSPFLIPWKAADSQDRTGRMVGRLAPGVSKTQAQADFSRIASQLTTEKKYRVSVNVLIGNESPPEAWSQLSFFISLFMSGVAVVLLIACDNIAILLLARVAARRREIGIRLALGATRKELIRQLVAENLLLSILGGIGAMIFALATARILERLPFLPIPDGFKFVFDWRVIAFAIVVSLATTFLFGTRPALQSVRRDVVISLNPGATGGGETHSHIRSTLVVTQICVCTAMLITASVLVRSQRVVTEVDQGFASDHVLAANINFVGTSYMADGTIAFYERLLERLANTPGIVSVCVVQNVPIINAYAGVTRYGGAAGRARVRSDVSDSEYEAYTNAVSSGHFATLHIPILQGRDFSMQDQANGGAVGIVNQSLARQLWPDESALGRSVLLQDGTSLQVVGVAKDSKYRDVNEPVQYALYRPLSRQFVSNAETIMVRTVDTAPMTASALLRAKVREIDPTLLVFNVSTFDQLLELRLIVNRIISYVAGVPGALAFILGSIGTYGTMALLVSQRRREIGVRIAVGAHPSEAVRVMMLEAMKWTALGLGLGVLGGFISSFWLSRNLERVNPYDPIAFAGTVVLVSAVAFLASYIPARRASRIDPMLVLREE